MREIKFKAYHKITKEIFNIIEIDFRNKYLYSYEKLAPSLFEKACYPLSECELMQYTGLKDCEGQEIYEGDIVKYFCSFYTKDCNAPEKGHIIFVNAMFSIVNKKISKKISDCYEIKVIGNIYQNPELIEVQE